MSQKLVVVMYYGFNQTENEWFEGSLPFLYNQLYLKEN